jgi:hypothetical protein
MQALRLANCDPLLVNVTYVMALITCVERLYTSKQCAALGERLLSRDRNSL